MGQSEYYKEKLKEGLEYQDFIFDKFYSLGLPLISYSSKKYQIEKGENKAGFEIKFDNKFKKTNNFYIETHEKKEYSSTWIKSGINRDDNTWLYIIGNYEIIYIFAKRHLISIQDKQKKVETKTSKGYLLPKIKADIYAVRIIKTQVSIKGGEWLKEECFHHIS